MRPNPQVGFDLRADYSDVLSRPAASPHATVVRVGDVLARVDAYVAAKAARARRGRLQRWWAEAPRGASRRAALLSAFDSIAAAAAAAEAGAWALRRCPAPMPPPLPSPHPCLPLCAPPCTLCASLCVLYVL